MSYRLFFKSLMLTALLFIPVLAHAATEASESVQHSIISGLGDAAREADLPLNESNVSGAELPDLAGQVIGTALSMIGVLFFILAVYGGFVWMTAKGESERVERGKETVIAATIGVVIIVASYALTNFVLKSLEPDKKPEVVTASCPGTPCQSGEKCSTQGTCINEGTCLTNTDCEPPRLCTADNNASFRL